MPKINVDALPLPPIPKKAFTHPVAGQTLTLDVQKLLPVAAMSVAGIGLEMKERMAAGVLCADDYIITVSDQTCYAMAVIEMCQCGEDHYSAEELLKMARVEPELLDFYNGVVDWAMEGDTSPPDSTAPTTATA
jgi:hypothetical protein